jgi:allophanate hydrolase subunit 1
MSWFCASHSTLADEAQCVSTHRQITVWQNFGSCRTESFQATIRPCLNRVSDQVRGARAYFRT